MNRKGQRGQKQAQLLFNSECFFTERCCLLCLFLLMRFVGFKGIVEFVSEGESLVLSGFGCLCGRLRQLNLIGELMIEVG